MTVSKFVAVSGAITYRARVKSGRDVVASRTFKLKRDAIEWHDAQKKALDLGTFVDPKAGKSSLGTMLDEWMTSRANSVAGSTLREEGYALKAIPTKFRNLPLSAIRTADLEQLYSEMMATRARSTVMRFRNTLSSFFGWAVKQNLLGANPVVPSRVPKGTGTEQRAEVFPFTFDELHELHTELVESAGKAKADVALFLGLTGLRWGELSALRVRDVTLSPNPSVRVSRSRPDGQAVRTVTKGGGARTVPLTAEAVAIVAPLLQGRPLDAPLFASANGSMLSGNNWKRSVKWEQHSKGRRVHDLRHSAATHWLSNGLDLKTVQTWLGHSTAKLTSDTYAHWMGSNSDNAAVARLNALAGVRLGDDDPLEQEAS